MLYSAYRHLGDDESLQDNEFPPDEYQYDVRTGPYYREAFLERAITPLAVELLRLRAPRHSERPQETLGQRRSTLCPGCGYESGCGDARISNQL